MADIIQQLFDLCVVPLLGVITTYIVKFIKKKSEEIDNKVTNENIKKYNDILSSLIQECVIATNQTYVDALKNRNAFDAEAQKEAFELTYNKVRELMTEELRLQLSNVYDDLTEYITTKIEAEVNILKTEVKCEN